MEYFDFQKCKAQLDVLDAAGALALENGCDAAQAGAAYEELASDFGHDGFLVEHQRLNDILTKFL